MTHSVYEHLTRLQQGPAQLVVSQTIAARCALLAGAAFKYDVPGALAAEQYGSAYISARLGLQLGLAAFLAGEAHLCLNIDSDICAVTFLNARGGVAQAAEGSGIDDEAWALDCASPTSPDEVRAYAAQCQNFVERSLRIEKHEAYSATWDREAFERYMRKRCELKTILDHLGVAGIIRARAHEHLQLHTEVTTRLAALLADTDHSPMRHGSTGQAV